MHTDVYEMMEVPPGPSSFGGGWGLVQDQVGTRLDGLRSNTSRTRPLPHPGSSSRERSQRSIFWTGLLLDSIVFVCAAGGKEKTDLVSKSSALQGLLKPQPSSSSSFSLP